MSFAFKDETALLVNKKKGNKFHLLFIFSRAEVLIISIVLNYLAKHWNAQMCILRGQQKGDFFCALPQKFLPLSTAQSPLQQCSWPLEPFFTRPTGVLQPDQYISLCVCPHICIRCPHVGGGEKQIFVYLCLMPISAYAQYVIFHTPKSDKTLLLSAGIFKFSTSSHYSHPSNS